MITFFHLSRKIWYDDDKGKKKSPVQKGKIIRSKIYCRSKTYNTHCAMLKKYLSHGRPIDFIKKEKMYCISRRCKKRQE